MQNRAADRIKEQVAEVRTAYEESKQSVRELKQAAVQTSREAVAFTDEWVRENAWKLFGVAVLVGLFLGGVGGRRNDRVKDGRIPR